MAIASAAGNFAPCRALVTTCPPPYNYDMPTPSCHLPAGHTSGMITNYFRMPVPRCPPASRPHRWAGAGAGTAARPGSPAAAASASRCPPRPARAAPRAARPTAAPAPASTGLSLPGQKPLSSARCAALLDLQEHVQDMALHLMACSAACTAQSTRQKQAQADTPAAHVSR